MTGFEITVLAVTVLGNLLLGMFALQRNPKSASNVIFTLLTLSFALWAIVTFFAVNAQTQIVALWMTRLVMFLAVPQAVLFMILMHTFPRPAISLPRPVLLGVGFAAIVVATFTLSPFVFSGVELMPGAAPQPQSGIGMLAFAPLTVGSVLVGLYFLIRKNIQARGIARTQARYMLIGASIMFGLIVGLNFVGVAFLRQSWLASYGPLFTLPFVGFTAYAIVRHKMMDIRVAVARSLSFSILLAAFFALYAAILIFAVPVVSAQLEIPSEFLAAAGALLAVLLARYVQDTLRRVTDRYLFQRQADLRVALVSAGRRLSQSIDIADVTGIVQQTMQAVVRAQTVTIFLKGEEEGSGFAAQRKLDTKATYTKVPRDNALVIHARHTGVAIIKDEVAQQIERETREAHRVELGKVLEAFEWLDVQVAMPLFVDQGLTGLILLGEKKSGDPYLQDDAEFLSAFAPQAATALENARLYKESLEFTQKLKEEVERATHELEVANVQLRNLDKAKSEFLSIASHQLYTPLTAIRGYLFMMIEGDYGELPEQQQPVIDILDKSAIRLIELIKNLLDVSRIESGRLELNLEAVDMAAMAKEIVQDLMPNTMNKDLDLEFHMPAQSIQLAIADEQRVRQVMLNMIDNAIKYTNTGRIDVSVEQDGDQIEFAVRDTGKGLAPAEINKLFTKFTRVGGASKYHTEGSGLGLYVAQQIVREHHGEVAVRSEGEGKGSIFSMTLPVQDSPRSLHLDDKASVVIKAAEAISAS